jgi:RHH-type rel operon transcriptional repressor/antitoxin RelB
MVKAVVAHLRNSPIRGPPATDSVEKSTGRTRSFLAAEAILAYLDTNEWQVAGIQKALSSLDRGKGIPHARVSEWIASWETRKERPAPKGV